MSQSTINNKQTIPEGYKQTTVGVIPEEWELVKLGDLGEFKNGINKDKDQFGYGFPLVNLNDVFELNTNHDKSFSLVNSTLNERKHYSLEKGDVLFVRSSVKPEGVGLTSVITNRIENAVYSGFLIRLRDTGSLFLEYKKHCFYESGFRKRLLGKSTISANTNINQVALKSLQIPIPPLPEQQKIAEILNSWDEAISTTQKLIDQLKLRNKGLAQQLLTGKKRLKGFEGEWEEKHLEYYFTERKETKHPELPLLSVGEIGVYPQTDSNKKDTSNKDKTKYKRICPGDIGYNTMRMWQGRSALSSLEGIVSPAYTIVTPKKNADGQFFAYLFKLDEIIHKFYRKSQGLVSDTLSCKFKDFKIVKVKTPPSLREQKAITTFLLKANDEVKLYQLQLETLKEQKKGLMQKLLTGEVRVK